MNIDLKDYVAKNLTKTDHLMRDLLQAVMLSGVEDKSLEWAICHVREAVETAHARVRA